MQINIEDFFPAFLVPDSNAPPNTYAAPFAAVKLKSRLQAGAVSVSLLSIFQSRRKGSN